MSQPSRGDRRTVLCFDTPCLRTPEMLALPEKEYGRPQQHNVAMIHVTVLSRRGCHLCEVTMKMARRIQGDIPFTLSRIDISEEPSLMDRHAEKVPVVLIDEVEVLSGQVRERELRRAIKRARWRRPISRILSRFRSNLPRGRSFL